MKAINFKNENYKITSEKGDFYITENNKGKLKMFAKKDVEVIEIESLAPVKQYKVSYYNGKGSFDAKGRLNEALQNETGRKGTTQFLQSI